MNISWNRILVFLLGFCLLYLPVEIILRTLNEGERLEQSYRLLEAREQNSSVLSYFRNRESLQSVLDKQLTAAVFDVVTQCQYGSDHQTTGRELEIAGKSVKMALCNRKIPVEHLIICHYPGTTSSAGGFDFPCADFPPHPLQAGVLHILASQLAHQTVGFVPNLVQADLSRKLLTDLGSYNGFPYTHVEFHGRSFPIKLDGKPKFLFWAPLFHPDYVRLAQEDSRHHRVPLRQIALYPKELLQRYLIGTILIILPREIPHASQLDILVNSYKESSTHLAMRSQQDRSLRFSTGFPAPLEEDFRLNRVPDPAQWMIATETIDVEGPCTLYAATPIKTIDQVMRRRYGYLWLLLSLGLLVGGGVLFCSVFLEIALAGSISRQLWTGFSLSALLPLAISFFTIQQMVDERYQFQLQQNRLKLLQEMESIENRYLFHRPWLWRALDNASRDPRLLKAIRLARDAVRRGEAVPEALKTVFRRLFNLAQSNPFHLSLRRLIITGAGGFFHATSPPGRDESTDLFRVLITQVADEALSSVNPDLFQNADGPPPAQPQYTQNDVLREYGMKYLQSIFGPEAFLNLMYGFNQPFFMGAGKEHWFVHNYLLPERGSQEFFLSWMYLAKQSDREALCRILARPAGNFRIYAFEADKMGNFSIPQAGEAFPILRTIAGQVVAARNRVSLRLDIGNEPCQVEGSPLTRSDQFVLVGVCPETDILAASRRLRVVLTLPLVFMLLLVFFLSWVASWDITVPLNRLKDGMYQIEEGRLSHRLPLGRSDELGEVAQAFNDMARGLEEAEVMKRLISSAARQALDSEADEAKARAGESIEVTVVFIGIPDFVQTLKDRDPEQLTEDLDRHTTLICRLIDSHGGIIDKLIGDKTLSFFHHAGHGPSAAADAAVTLAGELLELEASRALPFPVAIGINSGTVIKGLLGSGEVRDFTIIGDPVNLAARAESTAETLPDQRAVITENTLRLCAKPPAVKTLNITKVKGKQREVMLSQLFPVT